MSEQLNRLRALEPELRKRGVGSLYLFGSNARGEARADSDIDLFFDDAPNAHLNLLDVIGIQHFLQDILGMKIDLMTRDSLHPLLRADIESEAIAVF
ncbi:MAG: nucleotidyltransferase family protein [Phycisphaerales bacterium]|nr:nucleotidyltransferase family protein [Hyphomonadaceae bacterium]